MEESSPIIKSSLRHRTAALASAVLKRISSTDASAAEENVRSNQSKWWLDGDDPNHPAHNSLQHDVVSSKCGEEVKEVSGTSTEEVPDENLDDHDDQEGRDSDWDAPIFAYDDDYLAPSLPFGSLNSFQFKRNTANTAASSNVPFSVSTSSTLLPTWSQGPLDSSKSSAEEVIRSYTTYPNHYFCNSEKSVVHPITSESENDDSFCTSELSHDDSSTSIRTSTIATSTRHIKRGGHKRLKVSLDEDAVTLDEAFLQARTSQAKKDLLSSLEDTTRVDIPSKSFSESLKCLEKATRHNDPKEIDEIDGTWILISPPDYPSCLGTNMNGDKLYTLARMSFGMYQPGALLCSIQQQFNTISSVKNKAEMPEYVPTSLKKEVDDELGKCSGRMKTYNIIASFTIEGQDGDKALRGIMTNYAYTLPDPSLPGRLSIWFTGGTIEPAAEDEESVRAWKKAFGTLEDNSEDQGADKALHLAQHILLGAVSEPMDEKGVIGFHLKNPIGGHGSAFCDIVYKDNDMRVMRGHSGSVFVFKRTEFN